MKKSGLADSPFFSPPKPAESKTAPPPKEQPDQEKKADNEKEGSVYRSDEGPEVEPSNRLAEQTPNPPGDKPANQPTSRRANLPAGEPTSQLADQPVRHSAGEPAAIVALGPVVEKSKSFYISYKVDHWLDEGVRYLREQGLHKADRSVLVNALLHDPDLYTPEALDKLRTKVLLHLTNKGLRRKQPSE